MQEVRNINTSDDIKDKARAASSKKAKLGADINLEQYEGNAAERNPIKNLTELSANDKGRLAQVGVVSDSSQPRSGTILQVDNSVVMNTCGYEGVEIMSTQQALGKYDWLKDYIWNAVPVDTDKYTSHVELHQGNGYFIRSMPGSKCVYPVQACIYLNKKNLAQSVHNIIIAEEGSEMHIITGCTTASGEDPGLHLGVSEFYIKKGAKVSFTMIHNWNPNIAVRPRTGIIVEEDGVFLSNYVIMKHVKSVQTNPIARCVGKNAVVRFNSVVVAPKSSSIDMGGQVILEAPESKTEIISRAITNGGDIISRGYIEGRAPDVKGHLECRGLIMGEGGMIYAIPELKGLVAGIDLSHEAAVGKIAEEEVEYLMMRGLTRDEATATIVRGFLRVEIEGLPEQLNRELKRAIEDSEKELM
jgi:Fe-S cluster assembly scaffold protein SufB